MWANAKCSCAIPAKHYFLLIAATILCGSPAYAASHDAQLQRAENYLNSMKTMTAKFTQIAPDGSITTGQVYIQRPGKMRWEYQDPTPILMVSDGETLIYHDAELDQISYLPLDDSLAGFLTRPHIDLRDDALRVLDVREGAGTLRLTVLQTSSPDDGSLGLMFETNPMLLRQMVMSDSAGQITTVTFENILQDRSLDKSLFKFENPRVSGRRDYRR